MAQRNVTHNGLHAAEAEALDLERALVAAEALIPFDRAAAAALARERLRRLAAWNHAWARVVALRWALTG